MVRDGVANMVDRLRERGSSSRDGWARMRGRLDARRTGA